jgi:hypothetical protein
VEYADEYLASVDRYLHFGILNLSGADAEAIEEYSQYLAHGCEAKPRDIASVDTRLSLCLKFLNTQQVAITLSHRDLERITNTR